MWYIEVFKQKNVKSLDFVNLIILRMHIISHIWVISLPLFIQRHILCSNDSSLSRVKFVDRRPRDNKIILNTPVEIALAQKFSFNFSKKLNVEHWCQEKTYPGENVPKT